MNNVQNFEFGIDTFGDVGFNATGVLKSQAQVLREVVDEAVLAEQCEIDCFGVGEHHRVDGVADVRMIRVDKRNALDHAMFDGIFAAADRVAGDPSVRVVVLSGVGKAFCAGLDTSLLSQMAGEPAANARTAASI
mgnify:CR=1 FL=1